MNDGWARPEFESLQAPLISRYPNIPSAFAVGPLCTKTRPSFAPTPPRGRAKVDADHGGITFAKDITSQAEGTAMVARGAALARRRFRARDCRLAYHRTHRPLESM